MRGPMVPPVPNPAAGRNLASRSGRGIGSEPLQSRRSPVPARLRRRTRRGAAMMRSHHLGSGCGGRLPRGVRDRCGATPPAPGPPRRPRDTRTDPGRSEAGTRPGDSAAGDTDHLHLPHAPRGHVAGAGKVPQVRHGPPARQGTAMKTLVLLIALAGAGCAAPSVTASERAALTRAT